jgi:polyhydroxyalkanoate synthesis regulator phasin
MSAGRPFWRRGFDRAERLVGKPLEDLVATQRFNDLMVRAVRMEHAAERLIERQTRAAVHLLNLPARSDVTSLRRQVGLLRNDIRELEAKLDDASTRRSKT